MEKAFFVVFRLNIHKPTTITKWKKKTIGKVFIVYLSEKLTVSDDARKESSSESVQYRKTWNEIDWHTWVCSITWIIHGQCAILLITGWWDIRIFYQIRWCSFFASFILKIIFFGTNEKMNNRDQRGNGKDGVMFTTQKWEKKSNQTQLSTETWILREQKTPVCNITLQLKQWKSQIGSRVQYACNRCSFYLEQTFFI